MFKHLSKIDQILITDVVCLFFIRQVSSNDFSNLETIIKRIVKEKQEFVRLEMTIENLCEMFKVKIIVEFLQELHHTFSCSFLFVPNPVFCRSHKSYMVQLNFVYDSQSAFL